MDRSLLANSMSAGCALWSGVFYGCGELLEDNAMMSGQKSRLLIGALALVSFGLARAEAFTITFEGVAPITGQALVGNYYNGGSSDPNDNHGIGFVNALAVEASYSDAQLGNMRLPGSTAMYFLSKPVVLDVGSGFVDGFSFWYSNYQDATARVDLYDAPGGFDGGGHVLQTILLPILGDGDDPENPFSVWAIASGELAAGKTAFSIQFNAEPNQIAFDNLTFGSAIPPGGPDTPVPEPTSLALVGAALLAAAATRRRKI